MRLDKPTDASPFSGEGIDRVTSSDTGHLVTHRCTCVCSYLPGCLTPHYHKTIFLYALYELTINDATLKLVKYADDMTLWPI